MIQNPEVYGIGSGFLAGLFLAFAYIGKVSWRVALPLVYLGLCGTLILFPVMFEIRLWLIVAGTLWLGYAMKREQEEKRAAAK